MNHLMPAPKIQRPLLSAPWLPRGLALLGLLVAVSAPAHEIWFAQRAGQLALVYGHGAHDLDMVKRLPKITTTRGQDSSGAPVAVQLKATDHLVLVEAAPDLAVVGAVMDNGLWTKTRDGKWHAQGRDQLADAVQSARYYKYATHLHKRPSSALAALPGLKFQLIPAGPVFPARKGQLLTLQVLYDGKPAVGAQVYPDAVGDPGGSPIKVGPSGRVSVKVRNGGLNVVLAEYRAAAEDPALMMNTEHAATLSFMYDPPPE